MTLLQETAPAKNAPPLDGGTTQQAEASAFAGTNQASRDGLGDSCERCVQMLRDIQTTLAALEKYGQPHE
jgi:hypothetical protein